MNFLRKLLISVLMNGNPKKKTTSPNTYKINVQNNGDGKYILSGAFLGLNAKVILKVGDTVEFDVYAPGHAFNINTKNEIGNSNKVMTPEATGQGSTDGVVVWKPNKSGNFFYNCQIHPSMNGIIQVDK
jgi:hypothetical protein